MEKDVKKRQLVDDDLVITLDNVQVLGESFAISAVKTFIACSGKKEINKFYGKMCEDIFHDKTDVNYVYSSANDLVQTGTKLLIQLDSPKEEL